MASSSSPSSPSSSRRSSVTTPRKSSIVAAVLLGSDNYTRTRVKGRLSTRNSFCSTTNTEVEEDDDEDYGDVDDRENDEDLLLLDEAKAVSGESWDSLRSIHSFVSACSLEAQEGRKGEKKETKDDTDTGVSSIATTVVPTVHPELAPLRIRQLLPHNCHKEIAVNTPVELTESPHFSGSVLVMVRTSDMTVEDNKKKVRNDADPVTDYFCSFRGRHLLCELQLQFQLPRAFYSSKLQQHRRLYVGYKLFMKGRLWRFWMARGVGSRRGGAISFVQPEDGSVVFLWDLLSTVHRWVVTPPGQAKPTLGKLLWEGPASRQRRMEGGKISMNEDTWSNSENVYTCCLWSPQLDLPTFQFKSTSSTFARRWNVPSPMHFVVYATKNSSGSSSSAFRFKSSKHQASSFVPLLDLEFSHIKTDGI